MQFNKLVETIIGETEEVIGRIDGRRAVYELYIDGIGCTLPLQLFPWKRQSDRKIEYIDEWRVQKGDENGRKVIYDGPDVLQVFKVLDAFMQQHNETLPLDHKQQIDEPFLNIPVIYYTVVDTSHLSFGGSISIYAEVDTGKLRAQQIRDNLKDADTSGLEDLL
jgi:hypothetical protein